MKRHPFFLRLIAWKGPRDQTTMWLTLSLPNLMKHVIKLQGILLLCQNHSEGVVKVPCVDQIIPLRIALDKVQRFCLTLYRGEA